MSTKIRQENATEIRASGRPTNLKSGLEPLVEFAEKVRQLDDALSSLGDLGDDSTSRSVSRLRTNLTEFEPSVTLLGQVKSGKTSLVNAMAGWADLLPSDVNPWTSVVTSLHLTPDAKRLESRAKFRFFSEDEWDRLLNKGGRMGELADRAGADAEKQKIRAQVEMMREKSRVRLGKKFELLLGQEHEYGFFDKNLVERYICLGDEFNDDDGTENANQGRFADITKSADLYLQCDALPYRLCLRDTPGVNDTFMMREQITIQAIRDSRLCVVVLSAHQALTSVDMAVIRLISNLKSRDVVIFVNRIDELSNPSTQIPEIEQSIRQTLEDLNGPADARIIFGSAYWANKALAGDLDSMSEESSEALLNWATTSLTTAGDQQSAANMVWELSGLPELYRALARHIVAGDGQDAINKVVRSALNIANGLQVAQSIEVAGSETAATLNAHEIEAELDRLARLNIGGLNASFETLIQNYQQRSDKAHANFVDRATHSLIDHLEKNGEEAVWEYSPTGLRMLLRSAYNVFGTRVQDATRKQYEAAATDIATLYSRAFGRVSGGIQIEVPTVPHIPPPISLGQTIALDFRDGWWTNWWRRTRGYKAFAKKFQELIMAETESILSQLKGEQTDAIRDAALDNLADFLDEQREILCGLAARTDVGRQDLNEVLSGNDSVQRRQQLEITLESLSRCAA